MAFEGMLRDNHNRVINYVRLALTDRCNLRCFYCMPERGIRYMPQHHLLDRNEIKRLTGILADLGITKMRLTGGEPFLRKDIIGIMEDIRSYSGITDLHLTTNGLLLAPHMEAMKQLQVSSINLSLDTLDAERYKLITRRDDYATAMASMELILNAGIPLKINAVVMEDKNIADLELLARLTESLDIEVRFIEEMPFNGEGAHYAQLTWTYKRIKAHLEDIFGAMIVLPSESNSTAIRYQIPGFKGRIGIIAAYSRTFCGSCNRIRITAQGILKTCLYDNGVFSIRDLIRSTKDDQQVKEVLLNAIGKRPKDGFEAEATRTPVKESMSTIGG